MTEHDRATRRRAAIAGGVGNVIEWYDWSIYAAFAVYFGHQFFPSDDPTAALLSTFAVFAVGFVARPVGSITLGRVTDRMGRRAAMTLTVGIMAVASLLIGLAPTAASVGIVAALWLVILRIAQGLAVGAETSAVGSFLSESAGSGQRGRLVSVYATTVCLGTLLGTLLGIVLSVLLTPDQMSDFGWRIPFLVGGLLGLGGLYLRRGVTETLPADVRPESHPVRAIWAHHRADALRVLIIGGFVSLVYFTFINSFPSIAQLVGASGKAAYTATSLSLVIMTVLIPVVGAVSDRVGRRPVLITGLLLMVATTPVTVALMWDPSEPWRVFAAEIVIVIPLTILQGALLCSLIERFPLRLRGVGFGFMWAVAMALFGGTGPIIATSLASRGITFTMSAYVIVLALAALALVVRMSETAFSPMPD